MTRHDLQVLDTIETSEYMKGELSDDDMDIPPHMVPPNPDDSDVLPSQVHPSYPYGDPTNIKHPAAKPRPPYDPFSRALFEDMGYVGGVNGALRWKDLALDELMPIDEEKEEAKKAMQARKMASGTTNTTPQQTQQPQQPQQQQQPQPPSDLTIDEDEGESYEVDFDDAEDEGISEADEE
ncbi:hypothetical protein F5887DRAFT_1066272 [Amanita rubescens]|nr:hypothetical protein F5887DRAFT_1066272 [Amanita rubescens]